MQEFVRGELNLGTFEEFKNNPHNAFLKGFSDTEIKFQYDRLLNDEIWLNDLYQVNVDRNTHRESPMGIPVIHLSIKRRDKEVIHDWRELQEIKNLILGLEIDAVEVYPAESRRVDMANQFHLWCIPKGYTFPVGWKERCVLDADEVEGTNSKQRPLKSV